MNEEIEKLHERIDVLIKLCQSIHRFNHATVNLFRAAFPELDKELELLETQYFSEKN